MQNCSCMCLSVSVTDGLSNKLYILRAFWPALYVLYLTTESDDVYVLVVFSYDTSDSATATPYTQTPSLTGFLLVGPALLGHVWASPTLHVEKVIERERVLKIVVQARKKKTSSHATISWFCWSLGRLKWRSLPFIVKRRWRNDTCLRHLKASTLFFERADGVVTRVRLELTGWCFSESRVREGIKHCHKIGNAVFKMLFNLYLTT